MADREPASCRLYLITPETIEPTTFAHTLAVALDAGDVACVQLRLKNASDDQIRRACDILMPVAQSRNVAFILNDRPDLATSCGCDGVHVGQEDASYSEARRIMGSGGIVGVTCHDSRHLAMEAAEAGADYVAFGAFFPSGSKTTKFQADIELLEWWSSVMTVPVVAIGGITLENCGDLVRAGADFLAVIGAVWGHPEGPATAVRAFQEAIQGA